LEIFVAVKNSVKISSKFHGFRSFGLKRIDMVVVVIVIRMVTVFSFGIE